MARCDSYDFGECTYYCCSLSPWLPEDLGNATDWLVNAQSAGLSTGDAPMIAAIVVYGAGGGYSEFGHVAVVRDVYAYNSFQVSEMNFVAWDTVDYRTSDLGDVSGFIYPPSGYVAPGGGSGFTPGGGGDGGDVAAAWARFQQVFNSFLPSLTGWISGAADDIRDLTG